MKPDPIHHIALVLVAAGTSQAGTLLLSDNFDEAGGSYSSYTFNNGLAQTQSGSLATITYTTIGNDWAVQHSNGGRILVANGGNGTGGASLNHDFAADANAAGQALQISFTIGSVDSYADASRWIHFNIASQQNLAVADGNVGLGVYFRKSGEALLISGGSGLPVSATWSPDDAITITLSGTGGTGSAFNGNGSVATVSVGSTNLGSFTLAQQSSAYLSFGAFSYSNDQFGVGTFDNLQVSLVPEPGTTVLGSLGLLGLFRRRRS
ncbi:MAG: PEP-CTERM sorting domain-containing protein [Verrucomicrobia bacterium]|nr:PEP-CTERM sorting domain-containing protein [Verrucomicrobiota bacterium]